jgi:hypothetical protein
VSGKAAFRAMRAGRGAFLKIRIFIDVFRAIRYNNK